VTAEYAEAEDIAFPIEEATSHSQHNEELAKKMEEIVLIRSGDTSVTRAKKNTHRTISSGKIAALDLFCFYRLVKYKLQIWGG